MFFFFARVTAPFNNMRTLKFKAQPTNAFFATVNQMLGGSQLPTTAERALNHVIERCSNPPLNNPARVSGSLVLWDCASLGLRVSVPGCKNISRLLKEHQMHHIRPTDPKDPKSQRPH